MLIQLAIMGLLAALLPLTLVWVSVDANKYRKLAWTTVFLTFDLIMFGAFTRLTDSGLGCPDWPGCYGEANPFLAHADIHAAQVLMPGGPVTVLKAWIEMVHRYLAMGVGVLIIALMAIAWRWWFTSGRRPAAARPGLPTWLLFFVCLQGAFGAWTVTLKLQPVIVTTHLLLGMTLLALLTWLATRHSTPIAPDARAAALRRPAGAALALLFLQIALGGWVSTNYAALACADFPLCHGVLMPQMDFRHGFTLWRHLGKTAVGDYLPFPALTAVHWVHRSFAFIVVACIAWVGYRAVQITALRRSARWLLIAVGLQCVTGIATIFLNWPLAIAVLHNGGAALLVILLVMLNCQTSGASSALTGAALMRSSSF
ncbi:heme A synthase [Herminiimonas sp. CN]|uniref:COX15/CtaA family protein n=1 Tax=Herminiimonas sp. CN TaxID=1349818 RepID=UPI000473C327|nr:COX15/CtaA family protein [Herminiimonas sp. CN]